MIDISDGLASEIIHLCDQSGLGAQIFDDKIPIDPLTYERARDFQLDPDVVALNGGEDYELLFTIKQDDYKKIKGNPNLTLVGHMQAKDEGIHLVDKNGNKHALSSQGWDAFLNRKDL